MSETLRAATEREAKQRYETSFGDNTRRFDFLKGAEWMARWEIKRAREQAAEHFEQALQDGLSWSYKVDVLNDFADSLEGELKP